MIKNGQYVRDTVSGIEGYVTGCVFYLTGCNQVLIQPRGEKKISKPSSKWIDVQRIQVIDPNPIELPWGDLASEEKIVGVAETPSKVPSKRVSTGESFSRGYYAAGADKPAPKR